jgi:hypothetical protein
VDGTSSVSCPEEELPVGDGEPSGSSATVLVYEL